MKVLVLHTLPPSDPPGRLSDEFDLAVAAQGIVDVLPGAQAVGIRGEAREVTALLTSHRPDVVFNACEAPLANPTLEAHVASIFEWMDVPFTGSGSETLALCRRKDYTRAVLTAHGVPVPRINVFPCIVKPLDEDGSAGIDALSVCENAYETARAVARHQGPTLVEEFLPGREFAVALWGRGTPEHTSIGEWEFQNGLRLKTYASKWDTRSEDYDNSWMSYETVIEPQLRERIVAAACATWAAVEARGYMRVDIRLDRQGNPFVIDVNPNPELHPDSGICEAAAAAGWTRERFVRAQVEWALECDRAPPKLKLAS